MGEEAVQGHERVDACDVVVVGAGIVGALVADRLAQEQVQTAVLEAQTVAGGATGHSAGLVLTGLPAHYSQVVSEQGRSRAHEIWSLTGEGRERLVERAQALGVPVQRTGSVLLAADGPEAELLEKSGSLLREDGFDALFGDTDPLDRGFSASLRFPGDATIDVAALTRATLSSKRITLHEHTEVECLDAQDGGVRICAQGRTVLARAVVLAIDGYAPLFAPCLAEMVTTACHLVLVSAAMHRKLLERPCCAEGGRIYCRQAPDGRLFLGGWGLCDAVEPESESDALAGHGLLDFAAQFLPEVDVESMERVSGVGGFTRDGLPIVGRLPDLPSVCFAVGLGGRGLALAPIVAERVVELLLQDGESGVFAASRFA
jgi:glycine/D-amino acid oxidase-like deaminating enzyme